MGELYDVWIIPKKALKTKQNTNAGKAFCRWETWGSERLSSCGQSQVEAPSGWLQCPACCLVRAISNSMECSFPTAAAPKYDRLSNLKQYNLILSQFWRPEIQHEASPGGFREGSFLVSSSSWELLVFLDMWPCGHITTISASGVTSPLCLKCSAFLF